jgi:hypothetical protein
MAVTTWSGFIIPSHLNCPRMKVEAQKLADTYKSTDAGVSYQDGVQIWHLSDSCRDALIAIEDRMITELGALPGYTSAIIKERTMRERSSPMVSNRYPLNGCGAAYQEECKYGTKSWLSQSLIPLLANIEHEAMSAQYTAAVPALEARLAAAEEFIQTQAAALKAAEDRQIAVAAAAIFASQKLKEQEEINKKLLERLSALEKTF